MTTKHPNKGDYRLTATIINPGTGNLLGSPLIAHLFELEQGIHVLHHFWADVLCAEEPSEAVDACMEKLADAMRLKNDDNDLWTVIRALNRMAEVINYLILHYQIATHDSSSHGTTVAELLHRTADSKKPGPGPDNAEIITNLPWLTRYSLEYLLSDDFYDKRPLSGAAICARVMAIIVDRLNAIPGLNQEPPDDGIGEIDPGLRH